MIDSVGWVQWIHIILDDILCFFSDGHPFVANFVEAWPWIVSGLQSLRLFVSLFKVAVFEPMQLNIITTFEYKSWINNIIFF